MGKYKHFSNLLKLLYISDLADSGLLLLAMLFLVKFFLDLSKYKIHYYLII